MLKRDITYENFNGESITETFYFNLTKTELIKLEVDKEGGLQATIQRIIESKDNKSLIEEFQSIILMSYGTKSDDGKRFIKSEELREQFSQTAAYDALFMELATSDDAAAVFIKGVVPKDIVIKEDLGGQLQVLNVPPPIET
jgi:hypothetical protein